jgi:heme-degrading monooxygenase HmoA
MQKPAVARVWQGRTRESIAELYAKYLYEEGVKKLRATKGNRGVQVFRRVHEGIAEFTTISYWGSRDEIRAYAGEEYLLELPPRVKHFDILVDDWEKATR